MDYNNTNLYQTLECKNCIDHNHDTDDSDKENERSWVEVVRKKKNSKINEPCWFYNNGGCYHKNGTIKDSSECKYLHVFSNSVKRPPHLSSSKPCDKFNLEGDCKWNDQCKYSHRNLNEEEWNKYYPSVPYTLKQNIHKRQLLELRIQDLENKFKILEFKLNSIDQTLDSRLSNIQDILNYITSS